MKSSVLDYLQKLQLISMKTVDLINQKQLLQQTFKLLVRDQIIKMVKNLNSGLMELSLFQWEKHLEVDNLMLNIWLHGKIQKG